MGIPRHDTDFGETLGRYGHPVIFLIDPKPYQAELARAERLKLDIVPHALDLLSGGHPH